MKRRILVCVGMLAASCFQGWAQEISIASFQNGRLSISNSAAPVQRTLYSLEWRPNLDPGSSWSQSWSGFEEFIATNQLTTVDVPAFFRVAAYPDNMTLKEGDWMLMYSNAVVDAAKALPAEVSHRLTPVVPSNTSLRWRTNGEGSLQLKVVSFMKESTATNYYSPGAHTLSYGDQWVTVYPELKDFCTQYQGPDPLLRIKQVLGMPPTSANDRVVEFWVSPDYLFRPAAEPAINNNSAGVACSAQSPYLTANSRLPSFWATWYNATYTSRNYEMTDGVYNSWPWTQLGYTYDWGSTLPNHFGLSEYVVPSGTIWNTQTNAVPIEVEAILPANTYGKL